uniref:Uncharacterized protein n=1 Tax=Anguilla anguilla TaxID=7936 RepID=A0A0E9USL0_ANGAN
MSLFYDVVTKFSFFVF